MLAHAGCDRVGDPVAAFGGRLRALEPRLPQPRCRPMNAQQLDLFAGAARMPEGFSGADDFLSHEEEGDLVAALQDLHFEPFAFHGFVGRRRVVSFGWRYDFSSARLVETAQVPGFLLPLRDRAVAFAGVAADDIVHALVTEYAPGAAIGWHRDKADFDVVIGVSLLAPCLFRFRCRTTGGFERASFIAEPRSIYVLRGAARTQWEHSIPPVAAMRYSITFRTLR